MATRIRLPVQNRWKALAAQLLIGSLTCQISIINTALTTPKAYAATDGVIEENGVLLNLDQLTDLQLPMSAKNPAQTINRATDGSVVITAHVPTGTSKFTARLTDQSGKHVSDTARVTTTGIATAKIHASSLADGPIALSALIETDTGMKTPWVTGAPVMKDTVQPEKPLITAPLDSLTTDISVLSVEGNTEDHTIVSAVKDHAVIAQTESNGAFSLHVPLLEGANRFKIMATDMAGNESSSVSLPTITNTATPAEPTPTPPVPAPEATKGEQTKTSIKGGRQLIDLRPDQPITVETGSQTTHHGKLSATSLGHINPTQHALPGVTAVGCFYDITSSNQTVFPLTVRFYYTQAELTAGHVANERQLKGLYYYDAAHAAWTSFEHTTVHTEDVTVDGMAYAGYVEANTSHLTMMVIAADTIAPMKVTNLTAEAGDMRTKLTWNTVSDATGYWVRYRKATSIDTAIYTTVFVSGQQQAWSIISGLANGTLYEFGIATEDAAGNQSDFAVVEQTPTAAGPTTDFITPATAHLTSATSSHTTTTAETTPQSTTSSTNQSTDQSTPVQQKEDETPSDGTVKGGSDQKDQTQSARSLVTLLIVLIAAAAGFGGYYGYQWWTARPEEFDEPTEEQTEAQPPKKSERTDKSDKTGGRW